MRPPAVVKKERASSSDIDSGGAAAAVLKKGPWMAAEDTILKEYVGKYGEGNWNAVQKNSGLQRCGKSCRLRWVNHFRPNLKKESFSHDEEARIIHLHARHGNKWAYIAKQLTGRTDNEIKNYWNTRIKQRKKANLPLYPPDVELHMSLRIDEQEVNMAWIAANSPPPAVKPSQSTLSSFTSASSPLSEHYGFSFEDPNRGRNISFQLPYFPSPVKKGLENFDLGPLPYSVKEELPLSQFSSSYGGEQMPQGNSGLLHDLIQESYKEDELLSSTCLAIDLIGKISYWDCPLGIKMIEDILETDESALIDMILTETALPKTVLPDWYNNCSNGGESSNCPSSVTYDEQIGLDILDTHSWGGI